MIPGYIPVSFIGKGAASTIQKVRCQKTGKIFATKRVRKEDDPDGRIFEQVEAEFKIGQEVSHPNVIQIHKLHRTRKLFKVVELTMLMEYLEGRTLGEERDATLGLMVERFTKIAMGLRALHRKGYIHADIKPGNIMCCLNGTVKVLDLGQGCAIGSTKQRIQGTPDFIAPEQVLKQPLSERTDVFNLGATMYWCLTAKTYPTRMNKKSAGALGMEATEEIPTPQECNQAIPRILSNLVMDCCRNTPQNRPASMDVLIDKFAATTDILQRSEKAGQQEM